MVKLDIVGVTTGFDAVEREEWREFQTLCKECDKVTDVARRARLTRFVLYLSGKTGYLVRKDETDPLYEEDIADIREE